MPSRTPSHEIIFSYICIFLVFFHLLFEPLNVRRQNLQLMSRIEMEDVPSIAWEEEFICTKTFYAAFYHWTYDFDVKRFSLIHTKLAPRHGIWQTTKRILKNNSFKISFITTYVTRYQISYWMKLFQGWKYEINN